MHGIGMSVTRLSVNNKSCSSSTLHTEECLRACQHIFHGYVRAKRRLNRSIFIHVGTEKRSCWGGESKVGPDEEYTDRQTKASVSATGMYIDSIR